MVNPICSRCGCIMRKRPPTFIIVNLEVIIPDPSGDEKLWLCPICRGSNS